MSKPTPQSKRISRENGFKIEYDPETNTIRGTFITIADPAHSELLLQFIRANINDLLADVGAIDPEPPPQLEPVERLTLSYRNDNPW